MSTVGMKPLFNYYRVENPRFRLRSAAKNSFSLNYSKTLRRRGSFCNFKSPHGVRPLRAVSSITELFETTDVFFKETFLLKRIEAVCTLAILICCFFFFLSESYFGVCLDSLKI